MQKCGKLNMKSSFQINVMHINVYEAEHKLFLTGTIDPIAAMTKIKENEIKPTTQEITLERYPNRVSLRFG